MKEKQFGNGENLEKEKVRGRGHINAESRFDATPPQKSAVTIKKTTDVTKIFDLLYNLRLDNPNTKYKLHSNAFQVNICKTSYSP